MQLLDRSIAQRSSVSLQTTGEEEMTYPKSAKSRKLIAQWTKVYGQLICQWSRSN